VSEMLIMVPHNQCLEMMLFKSKRSELNEDNF